MPKTYLILFFWVVCTASSSINKDITLLLSRAKTQNNIDKILSLIPKESKLWWSIPIVPPIEPSLFHKLVVTSNFGMRLHPIRNNWIEHKGIDIRLTKGTDICAPADGIVTKTGYDKLLGNFVKIEHSFGFSTIMGHLDSISIKINQNVKVGDKIGECGSTGQSTGVHLHYSIMKDGIYLNPMNYVYFLIKKYKKNE